MVRVEIGVDDILAVRNSPASNHSRVSQHTISAPSKCRGKGTRERAEEMGKFEFHSEIIIDIACVTE